jgi:hypothetical protein
MRVAWSSLPSHYLSVGKIHHVFVAYRTETFEYGGFAAVEKRLKWVHRRMKALFPECSRFVYSHSSFWWGWLGHSKCGEVWIAGIPGG